MLARCGFVDARGRSLAATAFGGSRGYDAASTSRRARHWTTSGVGPNAVYYGDLETMRARAREAVRNNSYAASAVRTFVGNTVGTGIVPRWRLDDAELARKITTAWESWVDEADADGQMDFYGLQALVARTVFTSGESLVRLRTRTFDPTTKQVPLQLQVLEPDYLDSSKHGDIDNRVLRLGVEFDKIGRRRAYHLFRTHPGDSDMLGRPAQTSRVSADEVIHCYRVDRPGQVRGVPWLATVLTRLHQLDKYEDAELTRKQIAALFAGFITEAPGTDGPTIGVADEDDDESDDQVTLEPGIMQRLRPGEEIEFAEPADVGGSYGVFVQQQLRAIAAGIGITYEQLTGDLTGVNYSSIRAGLLEFRRWATTFQHELLVFQFCRRVVLTWLDRAVAMGVLDLPGYDEKPALYRRIVWLPPGWEWVDPEKDIRAVEMAVKAGLSTREEEIAKRGYHVEDIDEANARDTARMRDLGLNYTTNVSADVGRGSPSVQSPGQNDEGGE